MSLPIPIMGDTRVRMCPLLWDGVGEVTAITTDISTGIAMGDMQAGIVGGIRDGIGKGMLALTSATFGWLIVFKEPVCSRSFTPTVPLAASLRVSIRSAFRHAFCPGPAPSRTSRRAGRC
jgi:hypothetical protein